MKRRAKKNSTHTLSTLEKKITNVKLAAREEKRKKEK